ncbi:hypothetical protein H6P81_016784 [Aristolochia fimbriata]|uniref:CASP-like protein n=1 Tax=Aristolochia fimbriata TaxID=158543 RepID=A0AAV7E9P6_ARIFI|nr:hypothetical protein H6P81_016784 [Aristolochia fimbriata]
MGAAATLTCFLLLSTSFTLYVEANPITCKDILKYLFSSCIEYLTGISAAPKNNCCPLVSDFFKEATAKGNQKIACIFFKEEAQNHENIKPERVSSLCSACKLARVPFKLSLDSKCTDYFFHSSSLLHLMWKVYKIYLGRGEAGNILSMWRLASPVMTCKEILNHQRQLIERPPVYICFMEEAQNHQNIEPQRASSLSSSCKIAKLSLDSNCPVVNILKVYSCIYKSPFIPAVLPSCYNLPFLNTSASASDSRRGFDHFLSGRMSNSVDVEAAAAENSKLPAEPSVPPPRSESQATEPNVVSSIVERWKREDLLKKANSVLRAGALFFALIALLVVASNKHGDWKDFDKYEEYRYLLSITVMAFLYSGGQILRELQLLWTGNDMISPRSSVFFDFFGDQTAAYLLISALSAAASLTNRMREATDNLFTDASAAAISMTFFSFASLALSALVSGFKLSNQAYV